MSFHDAMYFSFVTFSTVGYGDIAPRGTQGRILTLTMIGCVWTVLPAELTKFSRLLDLRSKYSGSYKPKSTNHIIISCNVGSVQSVADFLKSFFQDDYGVRPTPVVVVVPSEPDEEWNKLLVKYNIQAGGGGVFDVLFIAPSCSYLIINTQRPRPTSAFAYRSGRVTRPSWS